jgi:hypothetical protein
MVAFHLHFEVLLHVSNVDLIRHLAGNPVDDDRHLAKTYVLTDTRLVLVCPLLCNCSPFYFEIHQLDTFGELLLVTW